MEQNLICIRLDYGPHISCVFFFDRDCQFTIVKFSDDVMFYVINLYICPTKMYKINNPTPEDPNATTAAMPDNETPAPALHQAPATPSSTRED